MKIRVDYEIPDGVINGEITNALKYGIRRWGCYGGRRAGRARRHALLADSGWVPKGVSLLIYGDRGVEYRLTRAKIKEGLRVLATKYPHHFDDLIRQAGDSDTSDALIQCALFGKVVY